jgi:D-serine deaminase-like pyridoxal phosphate-dependent protein
MIDSEQQIDLLESYSSKSSSPVAPWPVFIKIDVGSKRAGMVTDSPSLPKLIQRIESSPAASVYGFYCHAGHSYACRTEDAAAAVLQTEVEGVVEAAKFLVDDQSDRRIVVSVGSTPTAHVVKRLQGALPQGMELELHAGNYPSNDLQQVATSLVEPSQQAVRILADVCSVYPDRNEALINAGTVALSKETSEFPGFAVVVDRPQWSVVRMAQEHGILGWAESEQTKRLVGITGSKSSEGETVESAFKVGDKVMLYIQHACITAAMHFAYYVVDEQDIVRETWVPWKGW